MQTAQTSSEVNDILGQARQGSVAAIIQILNERLADSHIRTRAILVDGVLQLLCEAPTAEQLDKAEVIERVKTILEELSPRHIRKVNINSRIVREQQLLWFEEITRDPENQLLWSELIKLQQPNPVARFWQDLRQPKARKEIVVTNSKQSRLSQRYFVRGLVGGASLCLLLLLVGWVLKHRLGIVSTAGTPSEENVVSEGMETDAPTPRDTFAQAVRLAQQAAADGQQATTPAEWLDLAARWQRASELMAQVPTDSENYAIAQDRVLAYQQNSDQALLQAEQLQQIEETAPATDSVE
ncbi:hypothetical protein PN498_03575 [Oscillatoria sp. CS-180]|uniref:hypothetical protein n=1 Tax=Oscillatoria sp. CS-180 TaxID=3021720 RepID=UPI00232DEEA1|nr:hypothetical protein [Oscillatoria sp. CS-180]MDB9525054.1 hypothetical protein [Oscillatoria sp. CS-180]